MSSSLLSAQTFKEGSKINQQSQLQAFQALHNGNSNQSGGSTNTNQQSFVIQQGAPLTSSQYNTQSPLLNSSLQHKKVSQKIQLKVSQQVQGQNQQNIINAIVNSQSLNQQNCQLQQNIHQNLNTVIQQNTLNTSQTYNGLQQNTACSQLTQQNNSSSSSSVSSSYSLQSQLNSQNSLQNGSSQQNPNIEQQQPQQNLYSLQSCIIIANSSSIQQPNLQQINTQNQQSSQACSTITSSNGSGQAGTSTYQNSITSASLKKQPCDESGIYFSQKKKLLQIIQKQQREQQEFEKQQQQALNLSSALPQSNEDIIQEIQKNNKRQQQKLKPIKVITSPKSKTPCIRNIIKKYQKNISREENMTNLMNSSSIVTPQLQLNQSQANCNGAQFPINYTSPIKRSSNGMNKDEKFVQNNLSYKINSQNNNDEKLDSQETHEKTQEPLQDNFDDYRNILDEEDLAFLDEIENVCSSIPQNTPALNNNPIQNKVLFNKSFNKQITTQSNQQSNSSINTPPNSANLKACNDHVQINNSSINTKENDCPKVKESNFKRVVKANVQISTSNCVQSQQNIHAQQNQKSAMSQILNWFDNSFEKKNNSSNSEFFQALETEDSLATTQITALSSCTPQSISQNILNLFSPLGNSSEGSTINFNNTNSSIKQAIQSLKEQNSESSQLVFEQIKQQIELQKQQLQQQSVYSSSVQQEQEASQVKQQIQQQQQSIQQVDKKTKVVGNQVVKNAIQQISIENVN